MVQGTDHVQTEIETNNQGKYRHRQTLQNTSPKHES
jgi:hypothetical protein